MSSIRLPRLADRTPVKLNFTLAPELARSLAEYAEFYACCYGAAEPLSELVPAMLEAFLAADRAFVKSRKVGRESDDGKGRLSFNP